MLTGLRESMKHSLLAKVIVGAIVGLLAVSFAFFGLTDVLGGPRNAVTIVGDQTITVRDFARAFDRAVIAEGEATGQALTDEEAVARGLDVQLLRSQINDRLWREHASRLGVRASDDMLTDELGTVPAFQNPATGAFDPSLYARILAANNLRWQDVEADFRGAILRDQVEGVLTRGVQTPSAIAAMRVAFFDEQRDVTVVSVGPEAAAGEIADPTDEDLTPYFLLNRARFAIPDRRAITLLTLTKDEFLESVDVSEEDVQALFAVREDELTTPETRDLLEIAVPASPTAAVTAAQVAERLRAGEEPDAVAADLGLAEPNRYVGARADALFDPAAREAAFALGVGETSDPVEGALAVSVWRVDAITPAAPAVFADVEAQLRDELREDLAEGALFDAVDAFQQAQDEGAGLEEAATAAGVPVVSFAPVDQRGFDGDGVPVGVFGLYPQILQRAFEVEVDFDTSLVEISTDAYFALRVDGVREGRTPELDEVRERVVAGWTAEQRRARVTAALAAAETKLNQGLPLDDVLAEAGPGVSGLTTRIDRSGQAARLSPGLTQSVFTAAIGETVRGAAGDPNTVAAVRVETIVDGQSADEATLAILAAATSEAMREDLRILALATLEQRYQPRTDPNLLARATGTDQ